ncbi:AbrB family transcriptional regulator [Alphaproteobacteria bacterium]|nr:AbrB family transcriptional regulator [Alphaproteobacteria bacterium]
MSKNLISFLTAILIGAIGGAIAFWIRMPLAWMLGSMLAVTTASMMGAKVFIPSWFRSLNIGVIGVMLGATFSPELAGYLLKWWPSYLGLLISIVVTAYCCFFYLKTIAGLDPVTAFYSAMPGGLSEMVLGGGEEGGNTVAISVIHATRIFIIVMLIPFSYSFLTGQSIDRSVQMGGPLFDFALYDGAILLLCLAGGMLLAKWIRIPSSRLIGPMLMSAIVHFVGFTDARPPNEVVAMAQIVVGTAIGARFSGTKTSEVFRYVKFSAGSTLVMAVIASLMAFLVLSLGVGASYFNILLGLVPGGLAEMSLIALSLNLEVPFVSSHHIVRIFLVVMLAPLLFSLIRLKKKNHENDASSL